MIDSSLSFLTPLVGEQLSSVEFVQDYLQLHFDGPTLTLFVWPKLRVKEVVLRFSDPCYRDELCGRISHKVVQVITDDPDLLTILFDEESAISVSLRPEDRRGPETGHFKVSRDDRQPLLEF